MSYLPPPKHHLPPLAQHHAGHVLALRDYPGSNLSATISFVLVIIYCTALLFLLATTIKFTCKFRSRRRTNGRQAEGDTLGLVLVAGELCTLSDAMIYAVYYGFRATINSGILYYGYFDFTQSTATSSILVDFFIVGLVSYILRDRLRATSLEKQSRGLELANYLLVFIFAVIDITAGIMLVDYAEKWTLCGACYDNCPTYCDDSLPSLSDKSEVMDIVSNALYALLAGYWLALAIVALKRGKRMRSPFSLNFFLLHLLIVLPIAFVGSYWAIFISVTYFTALPATDAHYVVLDLFYFSYHFMVYLGLAIVYVKREMWVDEAAAVEDLQPQPLMREL